ncbi:aminotransferase class IV [Spirosoma linguale]|uniref:branched-chain-amino-acid transaminase n=1 Tax=Spirosoma linguale (strain ATCC 33905 / DSM 74 / LMG 10896 / Claus 1) TaxID=504472 RepID=D2QL14_SPILD|nr:aminotransferase class IV [Spirosoma linguale DSM 74]
MFLVYNSDILHESDFRLSINDRAFSYGDGIFETIRYESKRIWFWSDHFARLSVGMTALGLTPPENFTVDSLHQTLLRLVDANGLTNQPARIKLQVWRQAGGLYTPTTNNVNVLISARPGNPFSISEKDRAGIYDDFRLSHSPISACKTLNALPYILAGVYKEQHSLDDVLLLDTDGHMAECMASTLFWYTSQTLYTPSLRTGCINGIIRRRLLRLASAFDITVTEGLYKPEALQQAEAVFCANVMGIQWLNQVENCIINTSETAKEQLLPLLNQLHI